MKKLLGMCFFGIVFSLANLFCAGSMEAQRLAEGVNFDNRSEVIAYATALQKNQAVIEQAKGEGVSLEIWIKKTIETMTENFHLAQKEAEEKRLNEKRITDAEKNVVRGAILMDLNTQQYILSEFEKNQIRGAEYVKQYNDKTIQYTGEIYGIGNDYTMLLKRENGIYVDVESFMPNEKQKISSLNKGDVVTIVGKCVHYGLGAYGNARRFFLQDCSIK
jgi:hypothetical protein